MPPNQFQGAQFDKDKIEAAKWALLEYILKRKTEFQDLSSVSGFTASLGLSFNEQQKVYLETTFYLQRAGIYKAADLPNIAEEINSNAQKSREYFNSLKASPSASSQPAPLNQAAAPRSESNTVNTGIPLRAGAPTASELRASMASQSPDSYYYERGEYPPYLVNAFLKAQNEKLLFETQIDGQTMGEAYQLRQEMRAAKGDPAKMRAAAEHLKVRLIEVGAYSDKVGDSAEKAQSIRQQSAKRETLREQKRVEALKEFRSIYDDIVGAQNVAWRDINGRPVLIVKHGNREVVADVNPDFRLGGIGGSIIDGLQYHPLLKGEAEVAAPTSLIAQHKMIKTLFSNPELSPYAAAQKKGIRTSWYTHGGGDAFAMHLNATWSLAPGRKKQPHGVYQREDKDTAVSMRLLSQLTGNAPGIKKDSVSTIGSKVLKRSRQTGASQQNVYTSRGMEMPRVRGVGGVTGYPTKQLLVFSNLAGTLPAALINQKTSKNLQLGTSREWRFSVPTDQYSAQDRQSLEQLVGRSTQRHISIGGISHQLGGNHTHVDVHSFDDSVTFYDDKQNKQMTTITIKGVERGGGGQKIWGGNKNALLEANLAAVNAINSVGEQLDLSQYDIVTTMSGNPLAVMERVSAAQPFSYLSEGFKRLREAGGKAFDTNFGDLINPETMSLSRAALENPENRLVRQKFFDKFFQEILMPDKGMDVTFKNVMSQEHLEAMTNQKISDILANPQSEILRKLGIEGIQEAGSGLYSVDVKARVLPTQYLEDFTRVPGSPKSRLTPALRQALEELNDPAVNDSLSIIGESARQVAVDIVRAQALNEGLRVTPHSNSLDLSQVSAEKSVQFASALSQQMSRLNITETTESSAHLVSQAQIAALKEVFGENTTFYDPATDQYKAMHIPTLSSIESSRGISDSGQDFGLAARAADYISSRVLNSTRKMTENAEQKLRETLAAAASSGETRKALLGAGRDTNVRMDMAVPLAALRNNEIAMNDLAAYRAIRQAAMERGLWSKKYAAQLKENIKTGNMLAYSVGVARHPHAPGDPAVVANIVTQAELNRRYGKFAPKIRESEIGLSPTLMSAFGGDFDADQIASFILMSKHGDRAAATPAREILRRARLNPAGELGSLQKDKYRNYSAELNVRKELNQEQIGKESQQSMLSKMRMGIMFNLARSGPDQDAWYKLGKGLYQKALDLSGMSIGGELINEMLSSSYRSGQRRIGEDKEGKPVFTTSLHGLRVGTRISDQAMIQAAWGRSIYRALALTDEISPENAFDLLIPSKVTFSDEQRQAFVSRMQAMRTRYKETEARADTTMMTPAEIRAQALKSIDEDVYTGYQELMTTIRGQLGATRTVTYQDYERDQYGMPIEIDGKKNIITRTDTNQEYFNIQDTDAPAASLLGRIAEKDLRQKGLASQMPSLNKNVQDLINRTSIGISNIRAQGSTHPENTENLLTALQGSVLQTLGQKTLADLGLPSLSGHELRAIEVANYAKKEGHRVTPSRSILGQLREKMNMRPKTDMQKFAEEVDAHMSKLGQAAPAAEHASASMVNPNIISISTGNSVLANVISGGIAGTPQLSGAGGSGGGDDNHDDLDGFLGSSDGSSGGGGRIINIVPMQPTPPPPAPIRMADITAAQNAASTLSELGLPKEQYGETVGAQIQTLLDRIRSGQKLTKEETKYGKSIVSAYEKATSLLRRVSSEKVSGDMRAVKQIQNILGSGTGGGSQLDSFDAIRALFGDLGHTSYSKDAIDFFKGVGAGEVNTETLRRISARQPLGEQAQQRRAGRMLRESDFTAIQDIASGITQESIERFTALGQKVSAGQSLTHEESQFIRKQINSMRRAGDIRMRAEATMQRGNEVQRTDAALIQGILKEKEPAFSAFSEILYQPNEDGGGLKYTETAANLMQAASEVLAQQAAPKQTQTQGRTLAPMLRESDFVAIQGVSASITQESVQEFAALSQKVAAGKPITSKEARFIQDQIGAARRASDIRLRAEATMQRGNETQRTDASLVQDILKDNEPAISALNSMLYKPAENGIGTEYTDTATNLMQVASRTLAEPSIKTRGIAAELDALNQNFEKMSKVMREAGIRSEELTKAQVKFVTQTGQSVAKMREIQEQVGQMSEEQIESLPQGSIERYISEKTKTGELDKLLEQWESYLSRPTGKDGKGKSLYDLAIQQSMEKPDAYRNMNYDDMLSPFLDRSAAGRRRREVELEAGVYGSGLRRAAWQGFGNLVGGASAFLSRYWEFRQLNSIFSQPFSDAYSTFQQNRAKEIQSAAAMTTTSELMNTDTYASVRRGTVQRERTQLELGRGYSDVWTPLLSNFMGLAENRSFGQIGAIAGASIAANYIGGFFHPAIGHIAAGGTALAGLVSGIAGRRSNFEEQARYRRQLGDKDFATQATGDFVGWLESGMSAWLGDETALREIKETYGPDAWMGTSVQAGWANATAKAYNIGLEKLKQGDVESALQYGQARTYIESRRGLHTTFGLRFDPNMNNRVGRWVSNSREAAIDFQYTYGAINQLYDDFDAEYSKLASTNFRADIGFLDDESRRKYFYEALATFKPSEAYKQAPAYVAKQGELTLAGLSLQQFGQAFAPSAAVGTTAYEDVIKQLMGADLRTLKMMSPHLADRQKANAQIMLSGGKFNTFELFSDIVNRYSNSPDVLAREGALYDQFASLSSELDFSDAGAWYRYGFKNLLDKPRDFMAMMERSGVYAASTRNSAMAGYAQPGQTQLDVISKIYPNASAELVSQVVQYMSQYGLDVRSPALANQIAAQSAAGVNYEQLAQAVSMAQGENGLDGRRQAEIRNQTIERLSDILDNFERDNEKLREQDPEKYNQLRRDLIDSTNQTIQETRYAAEGAQLARQFGLTGPSAADFAGLNEEQIQLMLSRINAEGQRNLAGIGALTASDMIIKQSIQQKDFGTANRLGQQQEAVYSLQQQYARYGNQAALPVLDRMALMESGEFTQAMGVLSGDPLAASRYAAKRGISALNAFMYTTQTGEFGGRVGMPALYDEDLRAPGLAPVIAELSALDANQGRFASRYAQLAGIDTTYMNTLQAQTMSREVEFTQAERQRAMQINELQRRRAMATGVGSITTGLTSTGQVGELGIEAGIDKFVDTVTKKTIGQLLSTIEGGSWGIEDKSILLQREKQDYSLAMQERQQARERARVGPNGWEEAQWQERYWFNRGRTMVQLAWSQQDMSRQQYQQTRQMSWQREDFAFNRNQQQISFAWQMEDFDRNIRYARGRERRDLQRQQERAVIQNAMAVGRQNVEEARMNETQGWTKEQMKIDAERFEQNKKWTIEQMDMELRHHMQARKNQLEEFQEKQKQFEKEKSWLAEERVLEDKARALRRAEFLVSQKEQENLLQISLQEEAILRALGERINLIAARNEQAKVTLDYYARTGEMLPQIIAGMSGFINSIANLGGVLSVIGGIINVIRGFAGNNTGVPTTTNRTKLNRQGLGFASGGYTGDGSPDQIAGYVHRREYVVPEHGALVLRSDQSNDRMERLTEQMIDILRQIADNGRRGGINITVSGNAKEEGVKAALSMYDRAFS